MTQERIDRLEKKNLGWVVVIALVIGIAARSYFYTSLSSDSPRKECSDTMQEVGNGKKLGQIQGQAESGDPAC